MSVDQTALKRINIGDISKQYNNDGEYGFGNNTVLV